MVLGILISLASYNKEDDNIISDQRNEKWIEVSLLSDALTFTPSQNVLHFDKGLELIDGNLLPEFGSGSYDFTINREKIQLRSILSSNSNFNEYNFKVEGEL